MGHISIEPVIPFLCTCITWCYLYDINTLMHYHCQNTLSLPCVNTTCDNYGWTGNDANNQPNIEKKCFHRSLWRPPGYKDLWLFHSFATTTLFTMRFSVVGTVVALASVAQAHFQLQYPAPRGVFVQNNEPTFCGQSRFFTNEFQKVHDSRRWLYQCGE